MRKKRVLHISTAHQPYDPRIVYKQCPSLANDYEVWCALPNADSSVSSTIHFIKLPYYRRILQRLLITCPLVVLRTLWLRPAIVHIYVPEMLPFVYLFRLLGAAVVYEVQENLHKKMHLKRMNRGWLLERMFSWFDRLACKHFYLIFTEHGYLPYYRTLAKPSVVIYNYALLPLLEPFRHPYRHSSDPIEFFYIGWLSFERAFDTLVEAFAIFKKRFPDFKVHLFGRQLFSEEELQALPSYHLVKENLIFYNYTDQNRAFPYAAKAVAGLAMLKPIGDYPDSYTTKMFEYMALGLPVITTNFPLYKDVVERHQCGFCLDPYDPKALAEALCFLIENPSEAEAMGQRGRLAAQKEYSWDSERQKLLDFYKTIESL